ncbi:MAG: hypothetical protein ACR2MB_16885 [Acidimicrobiales bacterium]
MRTSKAEANGWKCPACGDDTYHDHVGRGYVQHASNPACDYERGERDAT